VNHTRFRLAYDLIVYFLPFFEMKLRRLSSPLFTLPLIQVTTSLSKILRFDYCGTEAYYLSYLRLLKD